MYYPPDRGADLPSSADLSADMPPIGDQVGSSCAAWAVGYYFKAFQEKKEHGWSVQTTDHQFSPYFVYSQVNGGMDAGCTVSDAFGVINGRGCVPFSLMPYTGLFDFPNQVQCEAAMPYRGDRAEYIFSGGGLGWLVLDDMKGVLANGSIFVLSIPYYSDFKPLLPPYFYDGPGGGATIRGLHSVAIVGYDNDRAGPGVGGFKCFNSWGLGWGDNGTGWLSYDFVGVYATEAWTMTDRTGYQPSAWMRVDIEHLRRGQLVVKAGVGDPETPTFTPTTIYHRAGGDYADIHASVDMTDRESYLPPSAANPWWVSVQDQVTGYVGTLMQVSLCYNGTKYLSWDTPVSIPDNGAEVVAYIQYTGVTVSPASPTTLDDLVATVSGGPDMQASDYAFAWYRDGVLQPGETTDTVSHTKTAKGETWRCVVTPRGRLGMPGEYQVTVANSPPTGTTASIVPGAPDSADDLVCSPAADDADGDAVSYRYQWHRNGVLQADLTSSQVAHASTRRGDTWECVVTPDDGTDEGLLARARVTVENAAPTIDWVATPGYSEDGVHPDAGRPDSTRFRFKARVTDPDGTPPTHIELTVQRLQDQRNWVRVAALPLQARPGNWAQGRVCVGSCRLPAGPCRYRFSVRDDEGASATGTAAAWRRGPVMVGRPQLWCTGLPGRETDGLAPGSGTRDTRFRFSVQYTDAEGDAPQVHRLALEKLAHDGGWRDVGSFVLNPWAGRPQDGQFHSVTRRLPPGRYRHRFVFRDADGPATGPLTRWQAGPAVGPVGSVAPAAGPVAITSLSVTPTRAGMQIIFSLVSPGTVDVRVLNVAGRPVRVLTDSVRCQGGLNTLLWDGQGAQGLPVPDGQYLVEVTTRDERGARSRVLAASRLHRGR